MNLRDVIHINCLEASARVGVTEDERREPQRLSISITLDPKFGLGRLGDRVERTVDYLDVAQYAKRVAAERPRNLIETVAEDLADALLDHYPLREVTIEVRKFVLPDAAFTAVRITRST
jgi:7,8-dihydroneopterin aldolase/epimerase/oxygenase